VFFEKKNFSFFFGIFVFFLDTFLSVDFFGKNKFLFEGRKCFFFFFKTNFAPKRCPKKTKISNKKRENLFSKKTVLDFKRAKMLFFFRKKKKNIVLLKKKASKLSVLKNGHFQFCPQKTIDNGTPPPVC
jgi:hypothetical protein